MLAAARLRHVAGTRWGSKRYMDMSRGGRDRSNGWIGLKIIGPSLSPSRGKERNPEIYPLSKICEKLLALVPGEPLPFSRRNA
jgi:hypothetical protein